MFPNCAGWTFSPFLTLLSWNNATNGVPLNKHNDMWKLLLSVACDLFVRQDAHGYITREARLPEIIQMSQKSVTPLCAPFCKQKPLAFLVFKDNSFKFKREYFQHGISCLCWLRTCPNNSGNSIPCLAFAYDVYGMCFRHALYQRSLHTTVHERGFNGTCKKSWCLYPKQCQNSWFFRLLRVVPHL